MIKKLVLHGLYILTQKSNFDEQFDSMTKLGLVLAGLCHDVGHTSHTNLFEINSYSKKALLYNDVSVKNNIFFWGGGGGGGIALLLCF